MSLLNRFSSAFNAFLNRSPDALGVEDPSIGYSRDNSTIPIYRESSVLQPLINRIAVDAASVDLRHVYVDINNSYVSDCESKLNYLIQVSANIDQTGRAWVQDAIGMCMTKGDVAVVPVDTDDDPDDRDAIVVLTARVAEIIEWKASTVKVRCYDDRSGEKKDIWVSKNSTLILHNPFYGVMNEPNADVKRLTHKIALADKIDADRNSSKLDLIIQLPYVVKTANKESQAEKRRASIEQQLTNSKYGIAYVDGTERITQLNRPIENTLPAQITELTNKVYSLIGFTEDILSGKADENTMNNYYSRIVEVFLTMLVEEIDRKWISKTAYTQGQRVKYFRNHFKLMSSDKFADTVDKLGRAAVMSSNEFRQVLGLRPSQQADANELRNKNLNQVDNPTVSEPSSESNVESVEEQTTEPVPEY